MLSVQEAFAKFRSNLEVKQTEEQDASKRQRRIREIMDEAFVLDNDFLTGSYARHTKIRPLKDVDIFCVLNEDEEGDRRKNGPNKLLQDVHDALLKHYSADSLTIQRRSVQVDFDRGTWGGEERVLSFDVVPAYPDGDDYKIPDKEGPKDWIKTNPTIHKDKATVANEAFDRQWKPVVKMLKQWNAEKGRPVKPSFLLEVMALQVLAPPFQGYAREVKNALATIEMRLAETWEDPAGLGPPVSDRMGPMEIAEACKVIKETLRSIDEAIRLEQRGNISGALQVWRTKVFGDLFPLT